MFFDILFLTDTQAKPKITYTYDAFGNILRQKGSRGINPYTFSTKEQDRSGLIYFGARYYEPKVGRWVTKGPLTWGPDDVRLLSQIYSTSIITVFQAMVFNKRGAIEPNTIINSNHQLGQLLGRTILRIGGLNPKLQHKFTYCFNNPVNLVDPYGQEPTEKKLVEYTEINLVSVIPAGPGIIDWGPFITDEVYKDLPRGAKEAGKEVIWAEEELPTLQHPFTIINRTRWRIRYRYKGKTLP